TAATGSALYWYFGYIQPMMAAVTAIGVLIGAMSGTKILVRITNKQVRWVFLAILAFLGMEMLLKGLYMDHIITIPVVTQYALSLIFTAIVMPLLYYRYGVLASKLERKSTVSGGVNA
ncbi:MAG: sulfite exporter TauE/SafE family protein, partial [Vulcanisaeta sp.]